MALGNLLLGIQDTLAQLSGGLERNPILRWSVVSAIWLLFMLRTFGRGTGQHRGQFNWYDWLVIVAGTALVWALHFRNGSLR